MLMKMQKDGKEANFEVEVVSGTKKTFIFKSTEFPPPSVGTRFFLQEGTELDVREQGMKVEDNKPMYYFTANVI
jgi:hypothetical protein